MTVIEETTTLPPSANGSSPISPEVWEAIQDTTLSREYRAQRRIEVQATFVRYGFDALFQVDSFQGAMHFLRDRFDLIPSTEYDDMPMPEKIRNMLQDLGPTWVKLGQMASTKRHYLPKEWTDELEKLQADVERIPDEIVQALVYRELGQTPEEAYAEFDYKPLGAASIGQVHRAKLHNGTDAAIKLQRPNIKANIDVDLELMREVARVLYNTTEVGKTYNAIDTVEEFAENLKLELSYKNEAQNTLTLHRNLAAFPGVDVPDIWEDLSTDRLITMELVKGYSIIDFETLDNAGLNRTNLSDHFIDAMTQQIVIDGFFHADPHPGNMFVKPSGTIVFIDMGMVGTLSKDERFELGKLAIAMQAADIEEIVRICLKLGKFGKPFDRKDFLRDATRILGKYVGQEDILYDEMWGEIMPLLSRYQISLPRSMTMAMKSVSQSQDLVLQLDPEATPKTMAERIKHYLFEYSMRPDVIRQEVEARIQGLSRLATSLPETLEGLAERIQSGEVFIELRTPDLAKSLEMLPDIANRILVGMALAGMMVGSAVAMTVDGEGAWQVIPALGVAGFMISLVISIPIVFYVLWMIWADNGQDN